MCSKTFFLSYLIIIDMYFDMGYSVHNMFHDKIYNMGIKPFTGPTLCRPPPSAAFDLFFPLPSMFQSYAYGINGFNPRSKSYKDLFQLLLLMNPMEDDFITYRISLKYHKHCHIGT